MIAAMVVDPEGTPLPYTCAFCREACEEKAREMWSSWDIMQKMGYRVVSVEVTVVDEESGK